MARTDDPRDEPRRGTPDRARRGLSEARRYTPRGRSVREAAAERAAGRSDPFRPALQVLAGGRAGEPRGAAQRAGAQQRARAQAPGAAQQRQPAAAAQQRQRAGAAQRAGTAAPRARTAAAAPPRAPARATASRTRVRPKVNRGVAPPRPGRPQRRLRVATVLVLAAFALIAMRLVVLQFTDADAYAADALEERTTTETIPAPRGSILDRTDAVLAHSVEARYVYADPGLVKDIKGTADALVPLLGQYGIARSDIVPKLTPHRRADGRAARFEYLARGVDIEDGEQIKKLNLAGIGVVRDERRDVPSHDLAASVLGFTGREVNGLLGIELAFDTQLRGKNGERVYEAGAGRLNQEIPGGLHRVRPAQPGSSVQLTIDRFVQFKVQEILAETLSAVKAEIGAAVVLDVQTGEVIAQASYPGFDAAKPAAVDDERWMDTTTQLVVDPGSTHKAIVLGAALNEGVITPDATVVVGPSIVKGDQTFVDSWHHDKDTRITLAGLLARSSNIGTIRIADKLGAEKLYEYQRRFGLGQATGEGLRGEAPGDVRAPKDWSGTSHGTIPIGNGVSVTPLQMAAVYACIANGGKWVQPHLVRGIVAPDGKVTPAAPPATRQVLDPKHADELRLLLEAPVVMKGGTGTKAAVPGHRVAGKTGTGGRVIDGEYARGYVASFIGFAPADAPRFVIAVFSHAPEAYGSEMTPAFSEMMSYLLTRYQVAPTGTQPPNYSPYP
jgi:cell division protein FtsI (penicillin-binding protein 3)